MTVAKPRATTLSETAAIEILRAELGTGRLGARWLARRRLQGIGDDAAVLSGIGGPLVWSIDTSAQGVHFERTWLSLEQAAARAMTAALSDLAAMGAKAVGVLCALTVPRDISAAELRQIARGQRAMAERHSCPVLGGNLCRGDRIEFTTTVLGKVKCPQTRGGARPGDEVWLVGDVGMAAAGLRLLQEAGARGKQSTRGALSVKRDKATRDCLRAWREPIALIERGQQLVGKAHSLIDVSDGLASEASHLANASRVRVELSATQLRLYAAPSLSAVATHLGLDALELMLYGGEDYVLLATGPARKRPRWARVIGRVCPGAGAWLSPAAGAICTPLRGGFDHLSQ